VKLLFFVESGNVSEVEDLLSEDPYSRHSITFRSAESLEMDKDGSFLLYEGTDVVCQDLREEIEDISEEYEGEGKKKILEKIEGAEEDAMEGFGGIFS